jgi:hypothetical protein
MVLTAIEHMKRAKLLRLLAQHAPVAKKARLLNLAQQHTALARMQAENPNLAPQASKAYGRAEQETSRSPPRHDWGNKHPQGGLKLVSVSALSHSRNEDAVV